MKKSLRWVVLSLLAFGLNLLPGQAQVQVQVNHKDWQEFPLMKIFGVNVPSDVSFSTLQSTAPLLKDLDVRYVRVKNNWGRETAGELFETPQVTVAGQDVNFSFTQVDRVVDLLKEQNVAIMFMNGYSPAGVAPSWKDVPDTTHFGLWYKINKKFAQHWKERNLNDVLYEVWNGTDSPDYFSGNPLAYTKMLKEACYGILESDDRLKVGGGGFLSGAANNFKNEVSVAGSYGLGNDLRVCNFSRFWSGQATGRTNLVDMVERGDDAWGSFRRWTDWFDFMHWEIYFSSYASYDPKSLDAVNYIAANQFFDDAAYILGYSDVGRVYLSHFVDGQDGSKGLVNAGGQKTPLYNALKLYNEMPFDRKGITISDPEVKGMASSDTKNAYLVLWNRSSNEKTVHVGMNNLLFTSATAEIVRIDSNNNGDTKESLPNVSTNSFEWNGTIPEYGLVVIRLTTGSSSMEAANFGTIVTDHHFWWFRASQAWNWNTFDPKTMTAYVGDTASAAGLGDGVNWGVSSAGVFVNKIPKKFKVESMAQGKMNWMDLNTQLVMRVNFQDTLGGESFYGKSIAFYDNVNLVFDPAHESNFCYPSCAREDVQIPVDFTQGFEVDLSEYVTPLWNGNAVVIFGLQNPGSGKYYDTHPEEAGKGLMVKFKLTPIGGSEGIGDPGDVKGFGFRLYPVPAGNQMQVMLNEPLQGRVNMSITDIGGRKVFDLLITQPDQVIPVNLSTLSPGVYFITLDGERGRVTRKFIKSVQ